MDFNEMSPFLGNGRKYLLFPTIIHIFALYHFLTTGLGLNHSLPLNSVLLLFVSALAVEKLAGMEADSIPSQPRLLPDVATLSLI